MSKDSCRITFIVLSLLGDSKTGLYKTIVTLRRYGNCSLGTPGGKLRITRKEGSYVRSPSLLSYLH